MAFYCPTRLSSGSNKLDNDRIMESDDKSSKNERKVQKVTTISDIITFEGTDKISDMDAMGDCDNRINKNSVTKRDVNDREYCPQMCVPIGRVRETRNTINRRERHRMHQLNRALDGLRDVIPSAHLSSSRKLSKIATLLSARSYIQMLNKSVQDMGMLLNDLRRSTGCGRGPYLHQCSTTMLSKLPPSADIVLRPSSKPTSFVSYCNYYSMDVAGTSTLNVSPAYYHQEIMEHNSLGVNHLYH